MKMIMIQKKLTKKLVTYLEKNLLIIDYGLGNNLSLFNALDKLDYNVEISSSINKIRNADIVSSWSRFICSRYQKFKGKRYV